jgi:taurine dioxygenase
MVKLVSRQVNGWLSQVVSLSSIGGAMERRGIQAMEAISRREREPFRFIGVRPLSPVIGAEIEGLDLRFQLGADEAAELRRAFLDHHVLVFRDQQISEDDHFRIASVLGFMPEPGRRYVTLPAHDAEPTADPVMLADTWRADQTHRTTPPAGALLHIHKLPRLGAGGDILFANMHLAYDLLSEPLQNLLSDLTAIHVPDASSPETEDTNMTAEHPVVIRHPVTGRRALFVNRRHTSHVVQLEPAQSEATLEMLCRHLEANPALTCRIRWTTNALVLWDNRSVQHLTLQDFRPKCLSGHLVSLAGDPPIA